MREGTLHLVYFREYEDSEERYDPFFNIYYTIFRNLPLSQMNRLNNKDFQKKIKEFCDKNYKETASNYENYSEVNMIHGSEYYRTYEDEFGKDVTDTTLDGKSFVIWHTRRPIYIFISFVILCPMYHIYL